MWIRAWTWVSGGKEKNGIETWRKGCEGMKWQTAIKKSVGMDGEHIGNEKQEGRGKEDGEKRMEEMKKGENTKGSRQGGRGNKGSKEGQ